MSQLLIEFAEFRLEEITTIDTVVGMFPVLNRISLRIDKGLKSGLMLT